MRLTTLITLTIAALALSAEPAVAASGLTGAGSTLVTPLEAEWAQAFVPLHGASVSYDPLGPDAGISALASRSVDFAVSDEPMTATQSSSCNACVQIPWALSAVGIAYHLNGFSHHLRLTGRVLAEIYQGQITRWNDSQLGALNPGARLPAQRITPVYRGDAAGETYAFTRFLSDTSSSWRTKIGFGTTAGFTTGVRGTNNLGVVSSIESTNGSIGYVAVSYLIAHGLPAAAVENAAAKFEYPNLTNIENAALSVTKVPAGNALTIVNPPKKSKVAYPISTFLYVIVPSRPAQLTLIKQWIAYALGAGRVFGPALDFPAVPSIVRKASAATLKTLH